jgi:diguanylate cyclase (GGDEF)-like protein
MIRRITEPLDGTMSNLQVKSVRDQLSGLLNKVSFQDQVSEKIAQYNPERHHVFIMLDADNFKQINDRLGHACGDQVIVRISNLLKQLFDDQIFVARIGGDEFAIYMEFTEYSITDIFHILNRRMDALFRAYADEFHEENAKCGLSISAGICVMPDEINMTFQKLYERTDAALYVSKRNGKGQYTLYREGMENE